MLSPSAVHPFTLCAIYPLISLASTVSAAPLPSIIRTSGFLCVVEITVMGVEEAKRIEAPKSTEDKQSAEEANREDRK
jgi:hypothetical protein